MATYSDPNPPRHHTPLTIPLHLPPFLTSSTQKSK